MYVRPQVEGKPLTLAVSGRLWRDALIMFDRESRSLWSQILGTAVAGPLEGVELAELPSQVTTWGAWKKRHPQTLVLVKPRLSGSVYDGYFRDPNRIGIVGSANPDRRLPMKTLVFGLEAKKDGVARATAIPFAMLEAEVVFNVRALGDQTLVVFSPPGEEAALAYERIAWGRELTFTHVSGEEGLVVKDTQTGSTWQWETGVATAGPLKGEQLRPVSGITVFWGVWARYHPETTLLVPADPAPAR